MVKEVRDPKGEIIARLLTEEDVPYTLDNRVLAIIGYGIQGRGQSLNQRDSGNNVIIGLRKGKSWEQALEDGWVVGKTLLPVREAVAKADIIHILTPDPIHGDLYKSEIAPVMRPGSTLAFSHGYSIHYQHIIPPKECDVVLLAPKGPGSIVRQQYQAGFGVPALYAVHQDYSGKAKETVLALARGIGSPRPGVLETTFKDETETDLFGEQVDLCGGIVELVKKAYETLVEDGRNPVLAYWEVFHELHGLIAPLAYKKGNVGMLSRVSDTAKYGAFVSGPRVVDENTKENMKDVLTDIKSGKFAAAWDSDWKKKGRDAVMEPLETLKKHPLEVIGKQVRKIMWPDEEPQ